MHWPCFSNCLKRTSAIKVTTMKITDDFHFEWKPFRAYHEINTFCIELSDSCDVLIIMIVVDNCDNDTMQSYYRDILDLSMKNMSSRSKRDVKETVEV